jgi:hypothetical protein
VGGQPDRQDLRQATVGSAAGEAEGAQRPQTPPPARLGTGRGRLCHGESRSGVLGTLGGVSAAAPGRGRATMVERLFDRP